MQTELLINLVIEKYSRTHLYNNFVYIKIFDQFRLKIIVGIVTINLVPYLAVFSLFGFDILLIINYKTVNLMLKLKIICAAQFLSQLYNTRSNMRAHLLCSFHTFTLINCS